MLDCPMSSPQMMTMLGLPACAWATPALHRTAATRPGMMLRKGLRLILILGSPICTRSFGFIMSPSRDPGIVVDLTQLRPPSPSNEGPPQWVRDPARPPRMKPGLAQDPLGVDLPVRHRLGRLRAGASLVMTQQLGARRMHAIRPSFRPRLRREDVRRTVPGVPLVERADGGIVVDLPAHEKA